MKAATVDTEEPGNGKGDLKRRIREHARLGRGRSSREHKPNLGVKKRDMTPRDSPGDSLFEPEKGEKIGNYGEQSHIKRESATAQHRFLMRGRKRRSVSRLGAGQRKEASQGKGTATRSVRKRHRRPGLCGDGKGVAPASWRGEERKPSGGLELSGKEGKGTRGKGRNTVAFAQNTCQIEDPGTPKEKDRRVKKKYGLDSSKAAVNFRERHKGARTRRCRETRPPGREVRGPELARRG